MDSKYADEEISQVPSPSHPGMFKYAVMPRVVLGYNYAAGPATAPATAAAAVPMTRFPRQPAPALTTSPTTTAFHQNTNPVLTTAAVPGQPPAQFVPPFTPTQTLLAAGPPFTRAVRPPPFHKPTILGKGLKRKLDDMKDKPSYNKTGSHGPYSGHNLYCKVCCVTLNAPLQAKQHFEGKNHAKKLKMFTDEKSSDDKTEDASKQVSKGDQVSSQPSAPVTTQAATTTATPTVPTTGVTTAVTMTTNNNNSTSSNSNITSSVKSTDTKLQSQTTDKSNTKKLAVTKQSPSTKAELNPEIYCKICGVSFNSPKQAQQHYQGKNHSKRVRAVNKAAANNKMDTPPGIMKQGSKFICVVCDIQVTSQAQLDNHLKGRHHAQRHLAQRSTKTLKGRWEDIKYAEASAARLNNDMQKAVEEVEAETNTPITEEPFSSNQSAFTQHVARKPKRDFSMYRTPSGKYYCSCCNVTLNSEVQFAQHVDSKKHKANNSRKYVPDSTDN